MLRNGDGGKERERGEKRRIIIVNFQITELVISLIDCEEKEKEISLEYFSSLQASAQCFLNAFLASIQRYDSHPDTNVEAFQLALFRLIL
jgi:hypothetical protein